MSKLVLIADVQNLNYGAMMFVPDEYEKGSVLCQARDVFGRPFIFQEIDIPVSPFPYYQLFLPKGFLRDFLCHQFDLQQARDFRFSDSIGHS